MPLPTLEGGLGSKYHTIHSNGRWNPVRYFQSMFWLVRFTYSHVLHLSHSRTINHSDFVSSKLKRNKKFVCENWWIWNIFASYVPYESRYNIISSKHTIEGSFRNNSQLICQLDGASLHFLIQLATKVKTQMELMY